jgi:hypothetical protein
VVARPGAAVGSVAAGEVHIGARVALDLTSDGTGTPVVPRWVLL